MDIFEILKKGESETVEFKARFNKETIVSLAAFANTKGGKVIVGADRKGRVTGIKAGRETVQRYLNEIKVEMRHTPTKPFLIPKTDLPEKLPVIQRQIIENMLKNPKITYNELADITGKTRETIRVHINKLKEMNLIKRIGPDKGGYWLGKDGRMEI